MNKWIRYFFHVLFTEYQSTLESFSAGEVLDDARGQVLADILNAQDTKEGKGLWVSNATSKAWNLAGAKVSYVGANSRNLPTKPKNPNVLILTFSGLAEGPSGSVYLQY